jgi:itaconyl-CoA hydratase
VDVNAVGAVAPKVWRGRFFEDLEVGDVYRSRLGRTISDVDNTWFTLLTLNTNQIHFNKEFAKRTRFGEVLVNSCLTLSVVVGLSVSDTSENAVANLSWSQISMPNPVFVGDTLWSETKVASKRESRTRASVGIVGVSTRGVNQRREVVIEFVRSFMVYKRTAPEVIDDRQQVDAPWLEETAGEGGR